MSHPYQSGYVGTGFYCLDFDECWENSGYNECHADANCINNDGSYDCECKEGFYGDGYINCFLDELCKVTKCHEDAICTSFEGFAVCTCKEGFMGRGEYLCSPICPTGYRQGFVDCPIDSTLIREIHTVMSKQLVTVLTRTSV